MLRISVPCALMLAASAPSPQKQDARMRTPGPVAGNASDRAAVAPSPAAVSAAANPAPAPLTDSAAEAQGRRTLSAAFVGLGAGEHLTVALHDGRTLVLRDVKMHAREYCGVQVGSTPAKYCGGYAEVAAAKTGPGNN